MSGFAWMHPDDEEWTMELEEQLERNPNSLWSPPAQVDQGARDPLVEKGGLSQAENAAMLRRP